MASKKISQAEARRLKKRVAELEYERRQMFNRYRQDYPGGVWARQFTCNGETVAALDMAQKLDCLLVGKLQGDKLTIFAVPKEKQA
jgi:hypothetical protein